jgi:hypothetical protein
MLQKSNRIFFAFFLMLCASLSLWGAEITVPRMELTSRGAEVDGSFCLSTNAAFDIALNGGYKYGVLLGLSFEAADLGKALAYRNFSVNPFGLPDPLADPVNAEDFSDLTGHYNALLDRYNNQAALTFRLAKATARELFGLPLEFSYFAGIGDPFCSGEEFALRYGIPDMGTQFTGFYYFPQGIGGDPRRHYNGLYSVQGTGFSFAFTKWENYVPMLYFYQDFSIYDGANFNKPRFSGDLRFLFNGPKFQAEAYMGMSGSKDEKNEIRGGILAFFRSGMGTEFLLQCGVPCYKVDEEFSIDNVYFLFEPRIKFGLVSLHTTFFYHPLEYLHIKTRDEKGKADINIKVLVGDLAESSVQGGFETTLGLKVYSMSDYSFLLGPFISFLGSGLQWDLKLRINPLEWEASGKVVEFFAGVKTSY